MSEQTASSGLVKVGGEFLKQDDSERNNLQRLYDLQMGQMQHFGPQYNAHQTLFLRRQSLSRLIYFYELYQKIIDVPGVICEFGVQWGAGIATLASLRGIFEPYNHSRVIYGFDTFEGFTQIDAKDGGYSATGDYATFENYAARLEEIMQLQESFSPLSHIKKFGLIKGDASETLPVWLAENPHAIVAMAILDMDVYKPTKDVLAQIIPRMVKGSLLVFDEVNCGHFPGETRALDEVIGLNHLKLRRFPHQPYCAWAVVGD